MIQQRSCCRSNSREENDSGSARKESEHVLQFVAYGATYCSRRLVRMSMPSPVRCRKCLPWGLEHQKWTTEQWQKVASSAESRFILHHMEGRGRVCHLTGKTMHQDAWWEGDKPVETVWCFGQCSALGSCHSCGCYFDTYHILKHCCWQGKPLQGNVVP